TYAVRRRIDRMTDGTILRTMNASEFEKQATNPPIWLPRKCVVDQHTWNLTHSPSPPAPSPIYSDIYVLKDVAFGSIKSDEFVIFYPTAGTRVTDYTSKVKGEPLAYSVPADLKDLDESIELAKSGKRDIPPKGRTYNGIVVLL